MFGNTADSINYWNDYLKLQMKRWFFCSSPFTDPDFPLREHIERFTDKSIKPRELILTLLQDHLALTFSRFAFQKVLSSLPLSAADVELLGSRLKHMNVVAQAMGSYYQLQGVELQVTGHLEAARDSYLLAISKYEEALASNPTNKELNRQVATCYLRKLLLDKPLAQLMAARNREVSFSSKPLFRCSQLFFFFFFFLR